MVDFQKLIAQENQPLEIEPRRLFGTLQRDPRYEYLRDVQGDVLDVWQERRNERDLVIKMNTGAGKTVVGLVILQSLLNEGKGPALYLCPDLYLVSQVQREADRLGIKCVGSGGSEPLPSEFYDSSAILVTTVQKLFNGRSVFRVAGRNDPVNVGAIVIDDAHKCLDTVQEQFTARIPKDSPIGKRLFSFFEEALKEQSVGYHADIVQGVQDVFIRVPYWSWEERLLDVARLFSETQESDELKFVWPFLKEVLANSMVVISGGDIEVGPDIIPINLVPSFDNARHRVYMSATLLDDSALIKDFAADPEAVEKPIKPKIGGDIGERLIISPSLIDTRLEGNIASGLVSTIQTTHQANVVVLVPSFHQAESWQSLPNARVIPRDGISDAIRSLSESGSNLAIFANRYDGLDLPDEICRVLVIDGLPQEHRLMRLSQATERQHSPMLNRHIAQRIEQGMGRGVRSRSDYCVVILTGGGLLSFMSQVDNQAFFTEDTKRQINVGKELSAVLKAESTANPYQGVLALVDQCLKRDTGWQTYHLNALQGSQPSLVVASTYTDLASSELRAWQYALKDDYNSASDEIANLISSNESLSEVDTGWYLQKQAEYLYHVDQVSALEKQLKAHSLNPRLLKPPKGTMYRKIQAKHTDQAYAVLDWMKRFNDPNALVIEVNKVTSDLAFGVHYRVFEEALKDLAEIIGFVAERPDQEHKRGPDVLWRLDNGHFLVIEAKNEASPDRGAIYKSEAEQLSHHATWFEQTYSGQPYTPVLIHPSDTLAHDAYLPVGAKVVQAGDLQRVTETVSKFVASLTTKPSSQWSVQEIHSQLAAYKLRSSDLPNSLLRKEARRRT